MKTSFGGIVIAVFTARPADSGTTILAVCPGIIDFDASWTTGAVAFHQLAMRDPGPTCGSTAYGMAPLPAAFHLLQSSGATLSGTQPQQQRRVTWAAYCDQPGATMLVVIDAMGGGGAAAAEFLRMASGTSRSSATV
jgi:hypothetical protein